MLKAPPFRRADSISPYPAISLSSEAGGGKTHFLGTAKKAAVIDTEGGSVTYSSPAFKNDPETTSPQILEVRYEVDKKPMDYISPIMGVFDYVASTKNSDGFDLVALDSITELQELFINSHPAKDPRQAYGEWFAALRGLVIKAKLLPVPVLFTSRLKVAEDEITMSNVVRPSLSPRAWEVVSGLFDVIARLDITTQGIKTVRWWDSTPNSRFRSKDRYGFGKIADPKWSDITSVLNQVADAKAA